MNICETIILAPRWPVAINPNSKVPPIVDPDGPGGKPFALFGSGAILIHLAARTGKLCAFEPSAL
jgi:GSH-dependent disulfide-bond oxidoreductase